MLHSARQRAILDATVNGCLSDSQTVTSERWFGLRADCSFEMSYESRVPRKANGFSSKLSRGVMLLGLVGSAACDDEDETKLPHMGSGGAGQGGDLANAGAGADGQPAGAG